MNTLYEYAYRGYYEACLQALGSGTDPNSKDCYGRTLLHWATLHGHENYFKLLLEYHGDPNIKDSSGCTVLYIAIWAKKIEYAKILLQHHANPNITNDNGDSPLHVAVYNNFYEGVQLLLDNGSDQFITNNKGERAKDLTKNKQIRQLIEQYEKHGYFTKSIRK